MAFKLIYEVVNGEITEEYKVISVTGCWATVVMSKIRWTTSEGNTYIWDQESYDGYGRRDPHPVVSGRQGVGSEFKGRALKDLTTDGLRYKCLKIYYGQKRVGVATRVDYEPLEV